MLSKIHFGHYKAFPEMEEIELRPITLVIGKNSSGKSSILKLLDRQMLDALCKQDISLFLHYRKHAIIEMTKRKLEDLGLEYEEYSHDGRDGEDGNIIDLLSEFSDLNNPERLELCEVLNNHWQCPSAVYDVRPSDDGNSFSINYNSFDHPYWLTDTSAARLLRQISERYCNGEDPIMYYSWLIASDD